MDFSVSMALVDMIPVFFFGIAGFLLMHDLYFKMSRISFALFSAGGIDIFMAGFAKAIYKLLYATGICNFASLSQMFFPVQALGFMMAGLGIISMFILKRKNALHSVAAPALFSGTMIFVGLMVTGLLFVDLGMILIGRKMKKTGSIILFVVSFIFTLGMGYLSSKDFSKASMNWIAEAVNFVGQGSFLAGVWLLHKAGLEKAELF